MFQNIRKVLESKYLEHSKHFKLFTEESQNVLGGGGKMFQNTLKMIRNILKMFLNILKVPEHILEMSCGKKFGGTF